MFKRDDEIIADIVIAIFIFIAYGAIIWSLS